MAEMDETNKPRKDDIFVERLAVPLTDSELLDRGEKLALLTRQRVEIAARADKDAAKKRLGAELAKANEELKALDEQAAKFSEVVTNRHEVREVECRWRPNFAAGEMEKVRLDTNRIVSTRPMEPSERQKEMELADVTPIRPAATVDGDKQPDPPTPPAG